MTVADAPVPNAPTLRERLHEFHLTGRRLDLPDPLEGKPLRPLAFSGLDSAPPAFPLCRQARGDTRFQPLSAVLARMLDGADFDFLSGNEAALAAAVGDWLARVGRYDASLTEGLEAALPQLDKLPEFDGVDEAALQAECQRLLSRASQAIRVFGFSGAVPALLCGQALATGRAEARKRMVERVRGLLQRLEGLLVQGDEPESSAELASELGDKADRFLDSGALARSLKRTAGHAPLDPSRRERVAAAAKHLRGYLERASRRSLITVFRSPDAPAGGSAPGVVPIEESDPVGAALERCRSEMDAFSAVLRAMRVAALEARNDYHPETHDRAIARFDWRAASREEAAAAPVCLAVDTAQRLSERNLGSLSATLCSGLPLQILVLRGDPVPGAAAASEGVLPQPDLAYLGIAHRDAFVLQAPLVESETLLAGFEEMSRTLRPALAVVAVPEKTKSAAVALDVAQAAWLSRATPAFRYDPEAGDGWMERFSLAGNVDPESSWAGPTPADAAALNPNARAGFAVLPQDAWDDEQVPLTEYLEESAAAGPVRTPYILVDGPNGQSFRALVTRSLTNACRDLKQSWRIYQELGGVHNKYAETAAAGAARVAEERHREEQERRDAAARREGAEAAVYRLVAALAGAETPPPSIPAVAPNGAEPSEKTSEPTADPVAKAPAKEAPVGPYIDSALCTSCDECINRNPQMFRYNDDRQAYIADAKAGTYKQLVKAAAACPANCIHPGPEPQ